MLGNVVPEVGIEPTWVLSPRDFESRASASSATPAQARVYANSRAASTNQGTKRGIRETESAMDEAALIEAAQRGDIDCFNALVLHHQDAVYNVAYRIMGEHDAACDAVQDAFISAYRSIRRFRGGKFRSWLMRIVTNACYDELRRRKRRPSVPLDVLDYTDVLDRQSDNPEAHAEDSALAQAIQDCINALPDDQRVVVVLHDVQAYSYHEAAEIAGVSLGTVKSRLSRARGKLRRCLRAVRELLPRRYRLSNEDM